MQEASFELGTDGPRSIVAGVDGSPSSLRAGAYAAGLARRQRSRLTVVFARKLAGSPVTAFDVTGAATAAHVGEMDHVERALLDMLSKSPWAVDAHLEVRSGHPAKVITTLAEEVRAEAVVIGCSRSAAFLLPGGPLPVQLIRARRWPVIVVP